MHSFEPYKEDSESFLEPLKLCPGHVPSQAGEVKTVNLELIVCLQHMFICYFAQAMMSKI